MASKMTKEDVKEALSAIGVVLLILFLAGCSVAIITLTVIGILKGYI